MLKRTFRPLSSAASQLLAIHLVILAAFTFSLLYSAHTRSLEHKLTNVATQIDRFFTEGVDYTNNVLSYMGQQIRHHDTFLDHQHILDLFQAFSRTPKPNPNLSWTLVSWVDPQNRLVVDAKLGVLNLGTKKIVAGQPHILAAQDEQWKVQLASPQLGNTSGKWIIPAALGVANNRGEYVGSLIFGFEIEKLKKQFSEFTFEKGIDFALVDQEGLMVLKSSEDYVPDLSQLRNLNYGLSTTQTSSYINPITGTNYFIYKLRNYPYALYLSFKPEMIWQSFFSMLRHSMLEIFLAAAALGLIIWYFYARVIKPVSQLATAANAVVYDRESIPLPRSRSHEMFSLARAILRMKIYKKRDREAKKLLQEANSELQEKNTTLDQYSKSLECTNTELKRTKNELESALQIIHDSDKEKESFLRDMNRALHMPIQAIINGSTLVLKQKLGKLSMDNYSMIFDAMYDAGRQLESLTTEFLNPSKVQAVDLINKCVTIQRRYATEKGVSMHVSTHSKLPAIWVDKLRFRQIILSTMHHSLLYIPSNEGKIIEISAKEESGDSEKEPTWLHITIEDNGPSMDETSRLRLWEKNFKGNEFYTRDPNMMHLDIPTLRHLVALHHGTFSIDTRPHESGNIFTIRLPYLDKEDLETHPDVRAQYEKQAIRNNERIDEAYRQSGNVIDFPERNDDKKK